MIVHAQRPLAVVLLVIAIGCLGYAAYIPAKAQLAQWLLDRAWQQRVAGEPMARPWPSADMRPVARLRQPRLGIDQVVLDDASARVLAFGPGHVAGSAHPGDTGNVVISGHRDTHFAWLRALRDGDELLLDTPADGTVRYRVARTAVYHESETGLLDPLDGAQLRLLTCYPFDGVAPGTPLRYVVSARRVPD